MRKLILSSILIAVLCVSGFSQNKSIQKINLSAVAINGRGIPSSNYYPNDEIKFKIKADRDCFVSILYIDPNGEKTWLPANNDFLEAGQERIFPDLRGVTLRIADNGVFGNEQVVVYASNDKECLPNTNDYSKFNSQDLQVIMRRQRAIRKKSNIAAGSAKINYTILRK